VRSDDGERGLDQEALDALSRYWAAVREAYYPFEEEIKSPEADVYRHEMPGGQYTNLRQQARNLGLNDRLQEGCEAYASANQLVGDIVKVTPSSKVVGDLALFLVTNKLTADDVLNARTTLAFPRSVVEMMQGYLGVPEDGWPKAFQERVLKSAHAEPIAGRPGGAMPAADFAAAADDIQTKTRREPSPDDALSYLLYRHV